MSIRTIPSAPNAEEIATDSPKVSNAQLRTFSGFQDSAAICKAGISPFITLAPILALTYRPATPRWRLRLRRKRPLLRPCCDRRVQRPHRLPATSERRGEASGADLKSLYGGSFDQESSRAK